MMPRRRGLTCLLLGVALGLAAAPRASAQVDPRGPVGTLVTPHLRVHFPLALDSLARVAAGLAETAYVQLARELAPPAGPIDLLLIDNLDVSNGFAQVFPTNRVVIYATPPISSRELRFNDDWLRLVITHELAHIFHLDRARGGWRAARLLFGRNPLLFPNAFTPSWVKEGLAIHYESALTGSGRNVGTEFRTLLRAASIDTAIPPMARWSLATTRFPLGQTAYGYGALLMQQAVTRAPDSLGMRRFIDVTASDGIPFLLGRTSRCGFGTSFGTLFTQLRDSSLAAPVDRAGDAAWQVVSPDGWYATAPRWLGRDSLLWSASNGREVTGLYIAPVADAALPDGTPPRPVRVAWRNALDVNVPVGANAGRRTPVVYTQLERRDPYVLRSDLYRGAGRDETRLTHGARLTQPDARADDELVAVQYGANAARLVRVSADGRRIVPLTRDVPGERWAEPRWSPAGDAVAAVQLLGTGEQRIVVLDTLGALRVAVAGARGVFASPSFTPDGQRLVWSSDRSGRMQLETAPVSLAAVDTMRWRDERDAVRQASAVSTGVYEPTVSPDGARVAALVQRVDGFHVVVGALDTLGPVARSGWYPARNPVSAASAADTGRRSAYRATPMLLPRYWLLLVGEGRDGRVTLGATSSGVDILERHAWNANVLVQPQRGEVDAFGAYRYAGLGVPVLDLSLSQEWDGTFRVVNDSNATLGLVARRRRFVTVASTWSVPRIRWSASGSLGAQYELRDFTADADSVLGPANSLLRRGTRYPSLFVNGAFSTARLGLRGISVEEGITLSSATSYRWREDAPSLGSWRTVLAGRGYLPLPLPGYARHVLAARAAVAVTDTKTQTEFSVGGTSGLSAELVPGVRLGDPARTFPVRGVAPGVQRGIRAVGGSVEYRAPLVMFSQVPSPFTVYSDRLSVALFSDAARAWCPATLARGNELLCERPGQRDGIIASAGAELVLDLALQYDQPYRVRIGAASPYVAPRGVARGGAFYVTLGGYF